MDELLTRGPIERAGGGRLVEHRAHIDVARRATTWLHGNLAGLTPDQLNLTEACGIWSVGDVIGHLVWGADIYADGIRRALAGSVSPPPGFTPRPIYAERAAWIADVAAAYRRRLGDSLVGAFAYTGEALLRLYDDLRSEDWDRPAFHPSGIKSIDDLLTLRIVEVSVHGWEALQRASLRPRLPEGSHAVIVDWLPTRLRPSFTAGPPLPVPLRYRFELAPPLESQRHVVVWGDRVDLEPAATEADADVTFACDPETYVLLMMGRLGWRRAIDAGTVRVRGSTEAAQAFPSWFGLT